MNILFQFGILIVGFTILIFASDYLVKASVSVAKKFGVSTIVIGLTIIAAGTSAPEIITSFVASFRGNSDIAIGNIVGSNMFNILGILGLTSLVTFNKIDSKVVKVDLSFLIGFTVLFYFLSSDLSINLLDASGFWVALILFFCFTVYKARQTTVSSPSEIPSDEDDSQEDTYDHLGKAFLVLFASLLFLILGSELALRAGVEIGKWAGLSDRIIGLTIISIGTGLPELATSTAAALRKQNDLAFANIIGSNIINTLGIPAAAGSVRVAQVNEKLIFPDTIILLVVTFAILPLALLSKNRFSKPQGVILLGTYISYLAYLYYAQ